MREEELVSRHAQAYLHLKSVTCGRLASAFSQSVSAKRYKSQPMPSSVFVGSSSVGSQQFVAISDNLYFDSTDASSVSMNRAASKTDIPPIPIQDVPAVTEVEDDFVGRSSIICGAHLFDSSSSSCSFISQLLPKLEMDNWKHEPRQSGT